MIRKALSLLPFFFLAWQTSNAACTAAYKITFNGSNYAASSFCQRSEYVFTDASTTAAGDSVTTWIWDFGDGNTGGGKSAPHVYNTTSASYTVKLTIYTALGCTSSVSKSYSVLATPKASFTYKRHCVDTSYTFTSNSTGTISSYKWKINNVVVGGNSTTLNYKFSSPGIYPVKLITFSASGCNDSVTNQVTVYDDPVVSLLSTIHCIDSVWYAIDKSYAIYGAPVKWVIIWGDGKPTETFDTFSTSGIHQHFVVRADPTDTLKPLKDTFFHNYAAPRGYSATITVTTNNGCVTTVVKKFDAANDPTADFTFQTYCRDTAAVFTDKSTVSTPVGGTTTKLSKIYWDFGDFTSAVTLPGQTAKHIYQVGGTYTVTQTAFSNFGCQGIAKKSVTVYKSPTAKFDYTPECPNTPISFTDASLPQSGTGVDAVSSWFWNFGDGNTSTQQNPNHAFADSGHYLVTLVAKSGRGCTDTLRKKIIVYPGPTVNFSIQGSCERDSVYFTDLSTDTNTIVYHKWFFGDGDTSALANPSHFYTISGPVNVREDVTNNLGCVTSYTKALNLNPAPIVKFKFDVPCDSVPITVHNQTLYAVSYVWDFGDGSPLVNKNDTLPFTHTYNARGYYTMKLTATTAAGCNLTDSSQIEVTEVPVADFIVKNTCNDSAVQFTDNSTATGTTVTRYSWNFGDGKGTSTAVKPSYKYTAPGSYLVTETVYTYQGCSAKKSKLVTTYPSPAPSFTFDRHCSDSAINFTNTSTIASGKIASWLWDFGDGITDTNRNPSHIFPNGGSGSFNVILRATSEHGCQKSVNRSVAVNQRANVDFDWGSPCPKQPVSFTDFSTGLFTPDKEVAWYWDLGDGSSSTDQNPVYTYQDSGHYNVTLYVTSSRGCRSQATKVVFVHPAPVPIFYLDPGSSSCLDQEIVLRADSTIAQGNPQYNWFLADAAGNSIGPQCTGCPPEWRFTLRAANGDTAGLYWIKLKVVSGIGTTCETTVMKPFRVYSHPVPIDNQGSFIAVPPQICEGEQVLFRANMMVDHGNITGYKWYFGDGGTSTSTNPVHTYKRGGFYKVRLFTYTDEGCTAVDSSRFEEVYAKPVAAFSANPNPASVLNNTVNFTSTSIGDNIIGYSWDFGDGFQANGVSTVQHTYPGDTASYPVRLIVENVNGCRDTIDDTLVVIQDFKMTVPTAFTVNGDSLNDEWAPKFAPGIILKSYDLTVMDRWGQVVFHSNDLNATWKGDYQGDGHKAPEGTYVYVIKIDDFFNEETRKFKGTVTLLR